VLFTVLNLRGVEASARINQPLCAAIGLVILVFFVATIRYIFHRPPQGAAFFTLPFHNPQTFSPGVVLHPTSLAVLTYIGFDATSTLPEEVPNCCGLTGTSRSRKWRPPSFMSPPSPEASSP
jgi:amino acid transporter